MEQITITEIPETIDISDIPIEKGKCLLNSYLVSQKYPNVAIVEGVIIIVYENAMAKVLTHSWNRLDKQYFDVTREVIWKDDKDYLMAKEIRYAVVKIITNLNLPINGKLSFCKETIDITTELTEELNNIEQKKDGKL